jgi:hypothetical protein
VFNLAATRPGLLTGVDPATGKPAPCGSVGVDINCAVIGCCTASAPTANLAPPAPTHSSHDANGEAVPQTAAIPFVTRRYSSGPLNFATHSPEDSQGDRKCRSARLRRTGPKGLFQYRTAVI